MNLAKSLKIESVSRLHPSPPIQLVSTQTVAEAISVLRREKIGCLLICDQGKLVGLFSERDLLQRIMAAGKPLTLPLADCMTTNPVTVESKDSIAVAIERMESGGYRHLPVVDDSGAPVGILSVKRIVHFIVEHFPGTVYNLPPDPNKVHDQREGA